MHMTIVILLCYNVLCYYSVMQTTIYIRKENEEFWNLLGKDKSKWVNEQIGRGEGVWVREDKDPVRPLSVVEPTYAPMNTPAKVLKQLPDPVEAVPKLKVLDNNALKELLGASGKQPIEAAPTHVCKDNCKHWVWDVDKGGRVNSITGEFQEGSPW